ncbi:MAG: redox-regulated ATPase YchF [Thermoproteota archaeon]|jgi:ribosome-binding ATPase YchF (GTP1/OBG family)
MVRVGIIGKTNVGKTTFFNAATLLNAKISTYPFTTKMPNYGRAYVQTLCVCKEFKVKDNPKNSVCVEGWRFIPVEIIDLPGLIEGAHRGRGLGNQFLKVAMSSDVLLHVVDASGSIDEEGKIVEPGKGDPVKDYYQVEKELVMWFKRFIEERKKRIERLMESRKWNLPTALRFMLSGAGIELSAILEALRLSNLEEKKFSEWKDEDLEHFSFVLRQRAKPTLIVANKMDLPSASENYEKLTKEFGERFVVPCSADAELALRRAEKAGMVKYVPGEETFKIVDERRLNDKQKRALSYVSDRVFGKWLRTGVQFAINFAVFKLLRMNVVYPVLDEKKLSDSHGNILPDAYLMPPNSTARDLAEKVHSDLAKHFIYAVDVRTGLRLPENYVLRDRDVIKVVAARKK